ncbi:MAG: oligosaccharide flippase family protein [Nitrososphaeria archaeon]
MTESLEDIAETSVRGSLFLFIGYFSSLVILAIGSIIVARLLGPDGYGVFSLAFVVPTLVYGLIDPGVGSALTRFCAKFNSEGRKDLVIQSLKTAFLFKTMVAATATIVCFVYSDQLAGYILNRPDMGFIVKASSLMVLAQAFFTFLTDSFGGLDRMEGNTLVMVVEAITKIILSPMLILIGFGVLGAVSGHILSYFFAILAGGFFFMGIYRALGNNSSLNFLHNVKEMVSYGFPLYLSSLIGTVFNQLQLLILAFFVSNIEIGNFNVAVRLLTLVSVLVFPFVSLFPAFSKVRPGSVELNHLFKMSVKYTALLIVPATVLVSVLARDVVFTLYGRIYTQAPIFLSISVLTYLYAGLGSIVIPHLLNGTSNTRLSLYSSVINFTVFLPLAYFLTSNYLVVGLVIAILISNTFSFAFCLWAAVRKVGVSFDFKSSSLIYLASILSVLPIVFLLPIVQFPHRVFALITFGLLFLFLYITLLPVIGAISISDVETIRGLFKKFKFIGSLMEPVLDYELRLLYKIHKSN